MKKVFFCLAAIISFFMISSCDIGLGLGAEVDLVAPELTITSPEPLSRVRRSVTVTGTCKDNVGVTGVKVTNRTSGESYGNARISGNNWTIDLYLPEGEVDLFFEASDSAGNVSTKSQKTILLLVDETAPEGLSWYIDRGDGVQVALMTEEDLNNVNTTLAKNKHIPQNEEFYVYGHFYDAMSIDTISLVLSKNDETIITKTVTAENKDDGNYIGDGKSIYAPVWKFTHDELVAARASLGSGKHYLKLSYYSTDEHQNSATKSLLYMMWYPESDYPGIQQSNVDKDGNLIVNVGSSIPLHFFDDDELVEVAYDFVPKATFDAAGYTKDNAEENILARKDGFSNKESGSALEGRSDWPLQLSAGETTGEYYILAYTKDRNNRNGAHITREKARCIKTTVTDASTPLLIMERPDENSIPVIKAGTTSTFEFAGYSYDTSGSKYVRIAYIPSNGIFGTAALRETRAKTLFHDKDNGYPLYDENNDVIDANKEVRTSSGEIIKSFILPTTKTKGVGEQWYIEPFNFEFDVLTDFGSEIRALKFFEIMIEDTDGNKVYKQYNVAADTVAPDIEIKEPAEDMVVYDYKHKNLTLKFKASKASNLGIVESKYKIVRKDHEEGTSKPLVWTIANGGLTKDSDGFVSVTISKEDLEKWAEGTGGFNVDVQPVFKFYAEDVLGNTAIDQRTVVLSPLPVLESVTVDLISGTYPARRESVSFQAKFSDAVKVTGSPRLKLKGLNPSGTDYYAVYETGSGTDTLTFKWASIPSGVYTNGTTVLSVDGDKIELNGGKIETGVAGKGDATISFVSGQNFWDGTGDYADIKREIKIDGIAPEIASISARVEGISRNADGNYYVNENREIVVKTEFTEKVLVTGNPVLKIGEFNFNLLSINDKTVEFFYKVEAGKNASSLIFNAANCISDSDLSLIKDEAGNSMVKSTVNKDLKIVIDTKAPGKPIVKEIIVESSTTRDFESIYNYYPIMSIKKNASDADAVGDLIFEYSLDGGLSWTNCAGENEIKITTAGSHILSARVKDKASNVSPAVTGIKITINDTFPTIQEISIAKADGKYLAGEKIDFKVFLSDIVEPFESSDQIYISFTDKSGNNEKKVKVTGSATQTNKLVFTYTVTTDDEYDGVYINGLSLGTIKDRYKNMATDNSANQISNLINAASNNKCKRDNLVLDGKLPYVVSYKLGTTSIAYPTAGITTADEKVSECENNAFKITLQFNENLVKESGKIILQRKGKWAIPPVFTADEFTELYNKMTVENRERMITTNSGNGIIHDEKLTTDTGVSVGPYMKTTHGLKSINGKAVPDTSTKFVLAYKYGLYEDLSSSDTTVSKIREALKSIDYDKHTIEVNTTNVILKGSNSSAGLTSNLVELSFPGNIEIGQEWELIIPDTAFHDETGNKFAGFKASDTAGTQKTFACWSKGVAAPVVRVNRYSHGWGAYGWKNNAETKITDWQQWDTNDNSKVSGRNVMPLGYAYARIDCMTPGATIKYQTKNSGSANTSGIAFTNDNGNTDGSHKSSVGDIDLSVVDIQTGGTSIAQGVNISVGTTSNDEERFRTARKDYVTAYATKGGMTSLAGYEGVFKTVVIAYKNKNKSDEYQINIEGGTAAGGEPNVSGFPLRDATQDKRYSKNAYKYTDGRKNFYAWVTYEIVSTDFAILLHKQNYSENYPTSSYGQIIYLYNYKCYSD